MIELINSMQLFSDEELITAPSHHSSHEPHLPQLPPFTIHFPSPPPASRRRRLLFFTVMLFACGERRRKSTTTSMRGKYIFPPHIGINFIPFIKMYWLCSWKSFAKINGVAGSAPSDPLWGGKRGRKFLSPLLRSIFKHDCPK